MFSFSLKQIDRLNISKNLNIVGKVISNLNIDKMLYSCFKISLILIEKALSVISLKSSISGKFICSYLQAISNADTPIHWSSHLDIDTRLRYLSIMLKVKNRVSEYNFHFWWISTI